MGCFPKAILATKASTMSHVCPQSWCLSLQAGPEQPKPLLCQDQLSSRALPEGQGLRESLYPGLLAQRRFFPPFWVSLSASLGLVNPEAVGEKAEAAERLWPQAAFSSIMVAKLWGPRPTSCPQAQGGLEVI